MESIKITIASAEKSFVYPTDKTATVDRVREAAVEENKKEGKICNLIFRGQLLEDGTTLSENGIAGDCMVRAIFQNPTPASPKPSREAMAERIHRLMFNFRTCMRYYGTGAARIDSLFKILSESLREISDTNANLLNDRAAYLMAQDPKLLRTLLHKPQYITEALTKHPALLEALCDVVTPLTESVVATPPKLGPVEGSLPEHFGMDYLMIDSQGDEDEEEEEEMDTNDPRAQFPASDPLTSNQLSSAIASAIIRTGATQASPGRPSAAPAASTASSAASESPATTSQRQAQRLITASDLFSAMGHIQTAPDRSVSSSAPGAVAASPQQDPWREQIRAMAELGFTDEQAVRQALEIAKGNIDMAVDILLG